MAVVPLIDTEHPLNRESAGKTGSGDDAAFVTLSFNVEPSQVTHAAVLAVVLKVRVSFSVPVVYTGEDSAFVSLYVSCALDTSPLCTQYPFARRTHSPALVTAVIYSVIPFVSSLTGPPEVEDEAYRNAPSAVTVA